MPRHAAVLVLVLGSAPASILPAQQDPVVASRAAYQQAVQAYTAHDIPSFLRYAIEAERLRPAHGGVVYTLASAYTLAGDSSAALRTLRRYAQLGYTADLAADSDFVSLRTSPAYDELRGALAQNAAPLARGRPAFTLPARDLLTEGIAHDPSSGAFFVSSVHQRKIVRVDRRGRVSAFSSLVDAGLPAPFGLRVDPSRGALWATFAAVPQMVGYDSAGAAPSGLVRFELSTGAITGRFLVPTDGKPHALGDLTVSRTGDVYATDSRGPVVYRLRAGTDSLERFVESPLLLSAQGLALDADERSLYVADYSRGLLRVDVATRQVRLVDVDDGILTLGIDGLYMADRDLVAIQNGVTPHRVVRLSLDARGDRVVRAEVLERARPDYAEPTLGVVVGRELFYIANSQWERFRDDGGVDAPERLQAPLVLRLPL
ncbi:MAG TPA: hypothetical protein VMY76_01410 [Gemmatimonadales bacterium]|nr:hypothetical protein [Gemmatimonadales bacterium]